LVLQLASGLFVFPIPYLSLLYRDELLFQVELPSDLPCEVYEIIGLNNQWIYFDQIDSKTGKSPGFTFPTLTGTDKITRVD